MKKSVIMLGAPGVGKGTQAKLMAEKFRIPHISTGDMLRTAVKEGTELGKKAKEIMERGELVPDDIMNGIVKERLAKEDCKDGYILDGFPRTIAQAEFLDTVDKINYAVYIDVPEELIVKRLVLRRTCPNCGAMYHLEFNPPKNDNVCDKCGTPLVQRDDDKEEVVKNRLAVYNEKTASLLDYYRNRGILYKIDGNRPINEVLQSIVQVIASEKE